MSVENSRKPLDGPGSAPNPVGGANSAPQIPSWWKGDYPLFEKPTPLSAFGFDFQPSGFAAPNETSWARPCVL